MNVTVGFHHTGGGDSLLPKQARGFFDGYTLEVDADTPREAAQTAMAEMYAMCSAEHPDWPWRAVDDLCAEIWIDDVPLEFDDEVWNKPFA